MDGFEEVVPGVSVNTAKGVRISVPHPDPCWALLTPSEQPISGSNGEFAIFTTEDNARTFIEKVGVADVEPRQFSWDDFVDFIERAVPEGARAVVDHRGESGFYTYVPVRKGI